jgi:hypothetical protein
MIDISVPLWRRYDLTCLYRAWIGSLPLGKQRAELVIHGFLDNPDWEPFTLAADETFRNYLERQFFPFRNFEVRS